MSVATASPETGLFALDIESTSSPSLKTKFEREGGQRMLMDLLRKAGLGRGTWLYKMISTYHVSHGSKPIRVRRTVLQGVEIWCCPSNNTGGIKGVLIVRRENGSAEEVFAKLYAANSDAAAVKASPPQPVEEVVVDDEEIALVLIAIGELASKDREFKDGLEYASEIRTKSGLTRSVAEVIDIVELCRENKWVKPWANGVIAAHGTMLMRTPEGDAFVADFSQTNKVAVIAPVAEEKPADAPLLDVGYLLTAYEEKLKKIAGMGAGIKACRAKQKDLRDQIAKLEKEYNAEVARENDLASSVDATALSKLLGLIK